MMLAAIAIGLVGGIWSPPGLGSGGAMAQPAPAVSPPKASADLPGPRQAPSPFVPGDLTAPVFDTVTPVFPTQRPGGDSATVVAEVEGRPITLGDVSDAIASLPPAQRGQAFEQIYPSVLEKLIKERAVAVRARQHGTDEEREFLRRTRAFADSELANLYMRDELSKRITETMLLARYQRDFAGKPGPEEVRLGIIATNTLEQAAAALAKLRAGEDFAALARAVSQDPTARIGGDSGFALMRDVVAEIAGMVSAMAPGQLAPIPLKAGDKWYVLKLQERRNQPTPIFAAVREQILEAMLHEAVDPFATAATEGLTIRRFDFLGQLIDPESGTGAR